MKRQLYCSSTPVTFHYMLLPDLTFIFHLLSFFRHSQPMSFTVSHSTSPDRTTLPAQQRRSSGLLCRRSDGLELATGQSPWPGASSNSFRQLLKTNLFRCYHSAAHSAVEILHDSALYKSIHPSMFISQKSQIRNMEIHYWHWHWHFLRTSQFCCVFQTLTFICIKSFKFSVMFITERKRVAQQRCGRSRPPVLLRWWASQPIARQVRVGERQTNE